MADKRQVAARSRPIRIAYLVDLSEKSHRVLDAIFHSAKRYWGGRFSLVVPCENGEIREHYREWLRVFDPDIIYSYVDLSEAARLKIHEQVYPAYLVRHRVWSDEEEEDHFSYGPTLPFEPLTTSTIVPILSRRSDFGGERTLRVINGAGKLGDSAFFRDNFGVEIGGLENDLNGRLSEFGSIWLADERDPNPRFVGTPFERKFSTLEELLRTIGRDRRTTTPMRLAAHLTPRLELRERRWSHSFNLIVGDTITDRIVYWNSRFAYPLWRDGDQVDLRLPAAMAGDESLLESLAEFLKDLPAVSGDNSGGSPIVSIRSSSLDATQLELIKAGLVRPKSWVHYEVDTFTSVDDCIPDFSVRWRQPGHLRPHRGISTGGWQNAARGSGDLTNLQSDPPDHLRHCPITLQSVHEGLWAVDLDIDRKIDYSPHSNLTDTWRLPRRLRTAGTFTRAYEVGLANSQLILPRTAFGGFLTLFAGGRGALPTLSEPSDELAITHALTVGRDWWPFIGQHEQPAQLCYAAERSNAGRYFWGALRLLGGLHEANKFLLHQFWRDQLARFGATDQRPEQRLSDVKTRIKRRLPNEGFNPDDEASLNRLSNLVLQEADAIRLTTESLTWTQLQEAHERYIEADWTAHPPNGDIDPDEWQGWERDSLGDAVQSLCVAGILHQGVEHNCRSCHHVEWVTIGNLDKVIICPTCGREEAAPVSRAWDFRLNGFLRDALRLHGVGPLFWALSRMRGVNDRSFWFEGPLDIYLTKEDYERRKTTTDLDLTVIANGTVRMCEIKQSARQLKRVEELADLMKQLRPDIATIAVMEPLTRAIQSTFDRFAASLKGSGVEAELITFDPDRDLRNQAFLGAFETVRLL